MKISERTIQVLKNILDRIPIALMFFLMILIGFLTLGGKNWHIITFLSLLIIFLIAVQSAIFMTLRDR